MNIKFAFTKNGPLLGDVTENLDGTFEFFNPVIAQPQQNNILFYPILGMCEEKKLVVTKDEINFNGQLFTPLAEIRNAYSTQFGSGIQLVTSPK